MCGIVGFTGNKQAAPVLLDGLAKLEYRGYDSAGIAVRDGEKETEIIKEKGKLRVLAEMTDNGNKGLNDFIMPLRHSNAPSPGSTDVGDVSWLTPTVQMRASCFTAHAPGHSWQNVSMGKTSIGHKGLILGGKVMALTAIDLYEDPSIIEAATEEFKKRTKAGFLSPIPMDAVPTIV